MPKITPHLWFERGARDAVTLYTSAFPNSRVVSSGRIANTPSGTVETVIVELAGQRFQMLFAGPEFKFTPAISFLAACATKDETEALWNRLGENGRVLMPLGAWPFSELFGWTEDRYGLSWQIMLIQDRPVHQTITPFLMFAEENAGRAEEAIGLYVQAFPDSELRHISRYGAGEEPEREGTVKHASFSLAGQSFAALDSARPHGFSFNEAISFLVLCEDQAEIDHYWNTLAADPERGQCGWLKDRFGLSWQIVPVALGKMMAQGSSEQIGRVVRAFLQMKKFDIGALEQAFQGP